MSSMMRGITLGALALMTAATAVAAQARRNQDDVFYFGGQGGVLLFRTEAQTQGGLPSAGGHFLIKAKRGGLLIGIDQAFGDDEQGSTLVDFGGGTVAPVTYLFDGIRRYQAVLMAFPVNWNVDPYFGAGVGIFQTLNTRPQTLTGDPAADADLEDIGDDAGSTAYGTLLGGLQIRANRFVIFGEAQITTRPGKDKLLAGPGYTIVGGARIGLGSRKELR